MRKRVNPLSDAAGIEDGSLFPAKLKSIFGVYGQKQATPLVPFQTGSRGFQNILNVQ